MKSFSLTLMFTLTICNICDFHGPLSTLWHTHCPLTVLGSLFFQRSPLLLRLTINLRSKFFRLQIMLNTHTHTHADQSKSICVIVYLGFSQLINISAGSRGEAGKVHCSNVILMKKDWDLQHSKRTNYFRNKNLNSQNECIEWTDFGLNFLAEAIKPWKCFGLMRLKKDEERLLRPNRANLSSEPTNSCRNAYKSSIVQQS